MCQLVLPRMRDQGWGRIVNISSMGANFVFPGGGAYHGTKYAVDALSDALRFEVKGFGVGVVIIQPGLIKTEFGNAAAAEASEAEGPYGHFNATVAKPTKEVYEDGPLAKLGGGPETVARGGREGDHRPQAQDPLPRHCLGAPRHRPAADDDVGHVGRDARHAVPAAGQVQELAR